MEKLKQKDEDAARTDEVWQNYIYKQFSNRKRKPLSNDTHSLNNKSHNSDKNEQIWRSQFMENQKEKKNQKISLKRHIRQDRPDPGEVQSMGVEPVDVIVGERKGLLYGRLTTGRS